MKDWTEYSKEAMCTESKVDVVKLNPLFLISVITIMKAAGDILDQLKKHVFYDKDYDESKIKENLVNVGGGLEGIRQHFDDINNEETINVDPRLFHAIVGISTESTELLEALKLNGEPMDTVNILEESFDIDWYQFILMDALGGKLETVWDTGIKKLAARYPNKFTTINAINRDLETERNILNSMESIK